MLVLTEFYFSKHPKYSQVFSYLVSFFLSFFFFPSFFFLLFFFLVTKESRLICLCIFPAILGFVSKFLSIGADRGLKDRLAFTRS